MPVFEVSALTTRNSPSGTNYPIAAFRSSTSQRAYVREIHMFNVTAPTTYAAIGLARSSAIGTGSLTRVDGVLREPGDTAPGTPGGLVTAWATLAPTLGTVFRTFACGTAVGNGVVWTFDQLNPLIMAAPTAATSELVFVQQPNQAPGTWYITIVWEE